MMGDVTKDMSQFSFLEQLLEALLKSLKWFWILSRTKLHVASCLHHDSVALTYSNLLRNIYPVLGLDFLSLFWNRQVCGSQFRP